MIARPAHDAAAGDDAVDAELRCGCGSLIARWVEGGVELKCRRCKRTIVLRVGARVAELSHAE